MTQTNFNLDGKVAIVTGSSRGIGEAIARGFAENGATVVLASRKQEVLDGVAESINSDGKGKAIAIACHTGKPDQIAALFERVESECGGIDILVNNSATNPYFGAAVDCPEWAFDKTFEVNVKGYFMMSQHAGKAMAAKGGGSIINVASIAAISPGPFQVVYSMTKAAVVNMTQGFAKELGPQGVRVNAIAPGVVETKFAAALVENPEIIEAYNAATPLRRHAQPNEMVGAALYLASEASSYTTGTTLVLDGGATA
jgi:NAD(P)-dependent dehydrogenase (short-subunit alcohol dehydrogenase family)